MPEALATTKRKFHKLLDALSIPGHVQSNINDNAHNTSKTPSIRPASIPHHSEFNATKRLRLSSSTRTSATISTPASRGSRYGSNNSSSSSLPRKLPTTSGVLRHANETSTSQGLPNFSPWSHATFLSRLKTYSRVSIWHPKPEELSEVEWAKRGWVCVDVNTVACRGGCERRVVVKVDRTNNLENNEEAAPSTVHQYGNEDDDVDRISNEDDAEDEEDYEKRIVERYKSLIKDGHAENCLWKRAGCKDDIYRLTLIRPSIWQPELKARLSSLRVVAGSIEGVTLHGLDAKPPATLPPHRILNQLPDSITAPIQGTTEQVRLKALTVALHGWSGSHDTGNDLLHCDTCFQRIGLWMYQRDHERPTSSTVAHEVMGSHDEDDEPMSVDLVDSHREHCPWRNATSQKATGTLENLNACEILLRVVSTYSREQRRKSNENRTAPTNERESDSPVENLDGMTETYEGTSMTKEEVDQLDKERESRLRRLKNVFTIKRRPTMKI